MYDRWPLYKLFRYQWSQHPGLVLGLLLPSVILHCLRSTRKSSYRLSRIRLCRRLPPVFLLYGCRNGNSIVFSLFEGYRRSESPYHHLQKLAYRLLPVSNKYRYRFVLTIFLLLADTLCLRSNRDICLLLLFCHNMSGLMRASTTFEAPYQFSVHRQEGNPG